MRRSKKTLRDTGLCEGNSPVTGELPAQRTSNAENVSIWWRHHICLDLNVLDIYISFKPQVISGQWDIWQLLRRLALRSAQNGHLMWDDIFKCIFVNEKFRIWIEISLNFVPKGPIDNNPALVKIMAWHRIRDKPLSEPMSTHFNDKQSGHSINIKAVCPGMGLTW